MIIDGLNNVIFLAYKKDFRLTKQKRLYFHKSIDKPRNINKYIYIYIYREREREGGRK